jgi:hypothetical protein
VADYDDGDDMKEDVSNMEYIMTTGRSVKHQARSPTDHFERLIEEACPNHVYPIKHKLKVINMMKNFMTSRSLTRDKEPEEDPSRRGATPLPQEDAVMMVYEWRPSWEVSYV